MLVHKGFRYRVYPTPAQIARLDAWSDALRFLWNLAHEQRLLAYSKPKCERRYPTTRDQQRDLTALRKEFSWLADVPSNICASLLDDLDHAWRRCFAKIVGRPHWKKRGASLPSVRESHPREWHINGDVLHFPKIGPMRVVVHRPLEGKRKTCTLVRDGDQWFASIACEIEINPPVRTHPVVAIDRGIAVLAATSDGELIANPRHADIAQQKTTRLQRSLSRKQKGSKNRNKARIRLARAQRKMRRQREHHMHVQTTRLAKNHGVVVIEKLNVADMVKVGGGLARSISRACWGSFAYQLRYKLAWSGGSLVEVPAAYSSQTCSSCGCVDARSRRSQAVFVCTTCGHAENADINAAKVLLTRANRSGMPVEGELLEGARRSRKLIT